MDETNFMITPEEFLENIRREGLPEDLHITRDCCSLIAVSDGKIIKTTEPQMKYCPLKNMLGLSWEPDPDLMKEKIIEHVEGKIDEFGFFTQERILDTKDIAIPYGASEMMMYDLKKRADAAVLVCDGAGTVVTQNPYLVQGIGARMTGLFYTTPIDKVVKGVEKRGGCIPSPGEIDQIHGLEEAVDRGYKDIDITVSGLGAQDLKGMREIEREKEISVTILSVCNTGIGRERIEEIKKYTDLVWSCASKGVREIIGKEAKIQVSTRMPVFGLTERSLDFLKSYSSKEFDSYQEENEGPYIVSGKCKRLGGVSNCKKIQAGNFETYIGEIDSLPMRAKDEPRPLI